MRADITRCDYAEARADAKGKLQKDKNERRRIVDTRNFLRRQCLANDRRIADRIDLLQQIRNNDESFQYELFKVAQTKGYYQPAQKATVTEIQTVKTQLEQ